MPTITVHGRKLRYTTNRRYIVVAVRPEPITTEKGTYVAFCHVEKRSDSLSMVRRAAARNHGPGVAAVILDTANDHEEIGAVYS